MPNWSICGAGAAYSDGDAVLFDDTAAPNGSVTVGETVQPSAIVVNNDSLPYASPARGHRRCNVFGEGRRRAVDPEHGQQYLFRRHVRRQRYTKGREQLCPRPNWRLDCRAAGATLDLNGSCLQDTFLTVNGWLTGGNYQLLVAGAGVDGNGAIVANNTNGSQNHINAPTLAGDTTFGGSADWDVSPQVPSTLRGNGYTLTKVGTNTINLGDWNWGNPLTISGVKNISINNGTLLLVWNTIVDNSQPGSIYVNPSGTLYTHCLGWAGSAGAIEKPIVMAGGIFQSDYWPSGNTSIAAPSR